MGTRLKLVNTVCDSGVSCPVTFSTMLRAEPWVAGTVRSNPTIPRSRSQIPYRPRRPTNQSRCEPVSLSRVPKERKPPAQVPNSASKPAWRRRPSARSPISGFRDRRHLEAPTRRPERWPRSIPSPASGPSGTRRSGFEIRRRTRTTQCSSAQRWARESRPAGRRQKSG